MQCMCASGQNANGGKTCDGDFTPTYDAATKKYTFAYAGSGSSTCDGVVGGTPCGYGSDCPSYKCSCPAGMKSRSVSACGEVDGTTPPRCMCKPKGNELNPVTDCNDGRTEDEMRGGTRLTLAKCFTNSCSADADCSTQGPFSKCDGAAGAKKCLCPTYENAGVAPTADEQADASGAACGCGSSTGLFTAYGGVAAAAGSPSSSDSFAAGGAAPSALAVLMASAIAAYAALF